MRNVWWKILTVLLLMYTLLYGMMVPLPRVALESMLEQTIRNLFFHVPMWFAMILLLTIAAVYSLKYLKTGTLAHDTVAVEAVNVAMLFGVLGAATGALWAKFTWGEFWPDDPKLNGVAIGLLIYAAYLILRNGMEDPQKRARVSAVYNVFAWPIFMVLIWILPRLHDSMHPGNGGNPGFKPYDLDNNLRMVFYPACLGWMLLSVWMLNLQLRIKNLQHKNENLQ